MKKNIKKYISLIILSIVVLFITLYIVNSYNNRTKGQIDIKKNFSGSIFIDVDFDSNVNDVDLNKIKSDIEQCKLVREHQLNVVKFGKYEQDGNPQNGIEDIEWYVLKKENKKALLLSKYILDCHIFNNDICSYKDSEIRRWLSDDFFNTAFSNNEKKKINETNLINKNYNDRNIFNCENDDYEIIPTFDDETNDFVFLLSYDEFLEYDDFDLSTQSTQYAINKGVNEKNKYWTRTLGLEQDANTNYWYTMMGSEQKTISMWGGAVFAFDECERIDGNLDTIGVRPAIYVDVDICDGVYEYTDFDIVQGIQTVKFGKINDEDVEWFVLTKNDNYGEALLVSKDIIDLIIYDSKDHAKNTTYSGSYIQGYLRDSFIYPLSSINNTNFIVTIELESKDFHIDKTIYDLSLSHTSKAIFLLSNDEYMSYFNVKKLSKYNPILTAKLTNFAKDKLKLNIDNLATKYNDYNSHEYAYWTRTVKKMNHRVSIISRNGSYNNYGTDEVYKLCGLRPAMWVRYK